MHLSFEYGSVSIPIIISLDDEIIYNVLAPSSEKNKEEVEQISRKYSYLATLLSQWCWTIGSLLYIQTYVSGG